MKKALYVHGFGSDSTSSQGHAIKEYLKAYGYDVDVPSFDLEDVEGTYKELESISSKYDLLIGVSLGGFYVSALDNSRNKIVLNPCMKPSVEIPKLDSSIPENVIQDWEDLENDIYENTDLELKNTIYGIFSYEDELFHYRNYFDEVFGCSGSWHTRNSAIVHGPHQMKIDNFDDVLLYAIDWLNGSADVVPKSMTTSFNESVLRESWKSVDMYTGKGQDILIDNEDEIFEILQKAYADIGGIGGNPDTTFDEVVNDSDFWKIKFGTVYKTKTVPVYEMEEGPDGKKIVKTDDNGNPVPKYNEFGKMYKEVPIIGEVDPTKHIQLVAIYTFKRGGKKLQYVGKAPGADIENFKKFAYDEFHAPGDHGKPNRGSWAEVSDGVEHIYRKYGQAPVHTFDDIRRLMPDKDDIINMPDDISYLRRIGKSSHIKTLVGNIPEEGNIPTMPRSKRVFDRSKKSKK